MTFNQAVATLVAFGIPQLAARSDNHRLREALRVCVNYTELSSTPPAISRRQLETLEAWMARPARRADQ
jgi:hypothetical protein